MLVPLSKGSPEKSKNPEKRQNESMVTGILVSSEKLPYLRWASPVSCNNSLHCCLERSCDCCWPLVRSLPANPSSLDSDTGHEKPLSCPGRRGALCVCWEVIFFPWKSVDLSPDQASTFIRPSFWSTSSRQMFIYGDRRDQLITFGEGASALWLPSILLPVSPLSPSFSCSHPSVPPSPLPAKSLTFPPFLPILIP